MSKSPATGPEAYLRVLNEKLKRELGPVLCGLLDDPTVIEIMLNPDSKLWVERLGERMEWIGNMPASQANSLISTVASSVNGIANAKNPILECEFPLDGSRFEALLPPVVKAPTFAIRKRAIAVFTLADYVMKGIMSDSQRSSIEEAVRERDNILIVGGTGSGKTTLTNAVIRYMVDVFPDHRLLILEDTRELQCTAENLADMRSGGDFNTTLLLKASMRLRPDRIIVGEVRDGAALALLKAWNTGHDGGVATLHASSAMLGLVRMEQLVREAVEAPMQSLIGEAVDLIVFIEKCSGGRRVSEVVRVLGHDGQKYITSSHGGIND